MIYLFTQQGVSWCLEMSSIATFLFKTTIGWLVNWGRNVTAEKLNEGDVADKKVRDLIVREVKDIKSKLDGLSRKDLLAAVDSFETGVRYLFQALDVKPSGEASTAKEKYSVRIKEENDDLADVVKIVSFASEMEKTQKIDLDEATKITFSEAERRFKMAREEATDACYNEALEVFDRITAIRYGTMATILESVVETARTAGEMSPESVKIALKRALPWCEQWLEEIHRLPAVEECFKAELENGLLGRFGREERRKIVSIVCQINRAIYSTTQAAGAPWVWPSLNTGKEEVVPLLDQRIRNVLCKIDMEHYCCVSKRPWGIAANSKAQFLIADNDDKTVKVFDSNGQFEFKFSPETDDADTKLDILDVATADKDDQIFLLVKLEKPGAEEWNREVQVFNKNGDLQRRLPVRRGDCDRLAVCSGEQCGKNLLLAGDVIDVHELSGEFVRSFGKEVFKDPSDITSTCDGDVMILDRDDVFLFDVKGHQLGKFNIKRERDDYYRISCHPASKHFVLAGNERETHHLTLAIYTVNGKFFRRIQLDEELFNVVDGITVTVDGHIALAVRDKHCNGKITVV